MLLRLVKYGVAIAFLILALTIFDLWPVVAGLGIIIAGLAVAGQSIVLDYLTGILLLFEYPFSIGDVVSINGVEGTVEEIGLRRVTVRDVSGTVHTIANGEIRITSNLTRYYANAVVDVVGVPVADVDRAIEVMSAVGAQLAADEAWSRTAARDARVPGHHRVHRPGRHASHVRAGAARVSDGASRPSSGAASHGRWPRRASRRIIGSSRPPPRSPRPGPWFRQRPEALRTGVLPASVREGLRAALGQLARVLGAVLRWDPRVRVAVVLHLRRLAREVERVERVDHDRQLLGRLLADGRLDRPRVRPVRDARGMDGE